MPWRTRGATLPRLLVGRIGRAACARASTTLLDDREHDEARQRRTRQRQRRGDDARDRRARSRSRVERARASSRSYAHAPVEVVVPACRARGSSRRRTPTTMPGHAKYAMRRGALGRFLPVALLEIDVGAVLLARDARRALRRQLARCAARRRARLGVDLLDEPDGAEEVAPRLAAVDEARRRSRRARPTPRKPASQTSLPFVTTRRSDSATIMSAELHEQVVLAHPVAHLARAGPADAAARSGPAPRAGRSRRHT